MNRNEGNHSKGKPIENIKNGLTETGLLEKALSREDLGDIGISKLKDFLESSFGRLTNEFY